MNNYTRSLLLILSFIVLLSCDDQNSTNLLSFSACGVENPAENLPWLKEVIESWKVQTDIYPYMYVSQGQYEGQAVIIFSNCCPFCSSTVPVFNCEGELLWYAPEHLDRTITDLEIIWKPLFSQCNL
jgi:hypothetical protein